MISTARLSDIFVEVADTLIDDFDLVALLDTLTDHVAALSGADAVGLVLADAQGVLRFMAASNDAGRALELIQIQYMEGPCRDAFETLGPIINRDLAHAESVWPTFAPRARAAGFNSVHAFPMRLRTQAIGALNLFSRSSDVFTEEEVRVVQSLADIATIAILQERSIAEAAVVTAQLEGALNSRIVIEQAKGALAQAEGIPVDEAFKILRSRARRTNTRLVDVAQSVLDG